MLLTSTGMKKILKRIMETGGMTEAMEQDIRRIKDDFDEREGILRRYGELYDGDDRDEYDVVRREEDDYREKYEELKDKYIERFLEPSTVKEEVDYKTIMNDTEKDVKRDGEPQTFDELLERTEG